MTLKFAIKEFARCAAECVKNLQGDEARNRAQKGLEQTRKGVELYNQIADIRGYEHAEFEAAYYFYIDELNGNAHGEIPKTWEIEVD